MGILSQQKEVKIKAVAVGPKAVLLRITTTWYDGPFPVDDPRVEEQTLVVGDEVTV